MDIIPISRTLADWQNFLNIRKQIVSSEYFDIGNKTHISYYLESLENTFRTNMLQHINYGFILIGTKEFFFQLMQYQHIVNVNIIESIRADYYVGIMTASLNEYVNLIKDCSTGQEYYEIREMANKIQKYLESEGFYNIFWNFSKIDMRDNTFRLVGK